MKRLVLLVFGVLWGAIFLKAQEFDRRAMLENITNDVIIPYHETFVEATANLVVVTNTFAEDPTSETLTQVQEAWKLTALAWQPLSVVSPRDVMEFHNRVNKYPTKSQFIEKFIADDKVLDADFIASIGSNSVGLPAMEYLIFDENGDSTAILTELTSNPRRIDYVVALAEGLDVTANDLRLFWSPDGEDYATTFVSADQEVGVIEGSANVMINELIENIEVVAKVRVGVPLGLDDDEVRPLQVEAYRSDNGLPQIKANVIALKELFMGKDGLGFDDYMAAYGQNDLVTEILTQFDLTISSIAEINEPLESAVSSQPENVRVIYDNLKTLIRYFKVDVVNQMGISITFNDADGD